MVTLRDITNLTIKTNVKAATLPEMLDGLNLNASKLCIV